MGEGHSIKLKDKLALKWSKCKFRIQNRCFATYNTERKNSNRYFARHYLVYEKER